MFGFSALCDSVGTRNEDASINFNAIHFISSSHGKRYLFNAVDLSTNARSVQKVFQ